MMKPRIYALLLALMMISGIPAAARAKEEVTVPMLQFTKKALPDAATKTTPGRVLSPFITPLLPSRASLQLSGICGTEC